MTSLVEVWENFNFLQFSNRPIAFAISLVFGTDPMHVTFATPKMHLKVSTLPPGQKK